MTHLQNKCLAASACFHGLTVVVLLATAAFHSEPVLTQQQVLTLIPARILDDPGVGGGPAPAAVTPRPTPPSPRPTPPATRSQPAPPAPAPPAPPRSATAPRPAPRPPAPTPASVPARRGGIRVDLTPATPSTRSPSRNTSSSAQAQAAAQAAAQEASRRRLQEITAAFAALDSSVHKDAVNVAPLPGEGGGEAFVNYSTAVFNAYNQAWQTPDNPARRQAVADVEIVVARNGDIVSSKIVSRSGDSSVDQSVQRALDTVERQKLPPFPTGAADTQRTFLIRFNLEAKQSNG